ncbi:hypothetical protein NUM_64410 [Actinocatenispora comari]|uniref:DUF4272 domain-containing protein n=2 Tax=Actinocatenispora comari TaxID=2807577 RepID=A0A8J4AKR9_9ACTN|nr:hypothetical protein NUM_64410 [Actinocatenispora comari]
MDGSILDRMALAPDPTEVRRGTLDELSRLGVRLPPPQYPLIWDPGDRVAIRPRRELGCRAAILTVLLAVHDGLPRRGAMRWLREARLLDRVSRREWRYIAGRVGDPALVDLQRDTLHGLVWVLGLADDLDPLLPRSGRLEILLPDPWADPAAFDGWLTRLPPTRRDPAEAAALLDLYCCLDWAYQEGERHGDPTPGPVPPVAIGARRWALEWAVVLRGPYHDDPPNWDDVDLSV